MRSVPTSPHLLHGSAHIVRILVVSGGWGAENHVFSLQISSLLWSCHCETLLFQPVWNREILALINIQPFFALSIMGPKDEGDGGGRVDGSILLSHQGAQYTRSNYGQVNRHLEVWNFEILSIFFYETALHLWCPLTAPNQILCGGFEIERLCKDRRLSHQTYPCKTTPPLISIEKFDLLVIQCMGRRIYRWECLLSVCLRCDCTLCLLHTSVKTTLLLKKPPCLKAFWVTFQLCSIIKLLCWHPYSYLLWIIRSG